MNLFVEAIEDRVCVRGIVVEGNEVTDARLPGEIQHLRNGAVSPADELRIFLSGKLRIVDQQIGPIRNFQPPSGLTRHLIESSLSDVGTSHLLSPIPLHHSVLTLS